MIAGAAGRDFHNFNLVYRGREDCEVVAFTATQIPDIEGRTYPAELAGARYPNGIPIRSESDLSDLEGWYERGLRSVGLVWSRPNAFAEGVPFRFPASPDTGPGLLEAR